MSTNIANITFTDLYDLKSVHDSYYADENITNDLYIYLCGVLDNINGEIVRQNKQRIKLKYGALQNSTGNKGGKDGGVGKNSASGGKKSAPTWQPVNANTSSATGNSKSGWRREDGDANTARKPLSNSGAMIKSGASGNNTMKTPMRKSGGILAQLLGLDKVKVGINRELNKLSQSNIDGITDAIIDLFVTWLMDELNKDDVDITKLPGQYTEYLNELWSNCISKSLSQENLTDAYFRFLKRIINTSSNTILNALKDKSPVLASKISGDWQPSFDYIIDRKNELIDEIMDFLKRVDYFDNEDNNLQILTGINNLLNANIDVSFRILGQFMRGFLEISSSGKRMRNTQTDIILLAIYDNFRNLNELLYWEPINILEVERRVFFTIGYLADNKAFVQSLDTDFYRDIECELDSIKKCGSIPSTIKYKLFDCIDNFISTRNRK